LSLYRAPGRILLASGCHTPNRIPDVIDNQLRPELTFTSLGRHGGATEANTSGRTETQLMTKGQWCSTPAMGNYLHDDDEGKQDAQMKRMKRRAKYGKG
jgi:hypothetical protein